MIRGKKDGMYRFTWPFHVWWFQRGWEALWEESMKGTLVSMIIMWKNNLAFKIDALLL